ncbi:MAG: lysostaphin resistance A-like protein [Longimicrobiales bacterium]
MSLHREATWAARGRALLRLALFVALFVPLWLAVAGLAAWLAPRLVGTGMPALLSVQGIGMLVAALVAGWLVLALVERQPPAALGFGLRRPIAAELGLGLALGVGMLVAVLLPLLLTGRIAFVGEPGTFGGVMAAWAGGLVLLALPAAAEEALFRGYPFRAMVQAFGAPGAVLALSALFAIAHANNPAVGELALLNIVLAGVLLSLAFLWTGSLWFATGLHLGWNWAVGSLADLPVSGLTFLNTPGYEPRDAGPGWLTGGAFGPEGGLAGSVAFAIGTIGVYLLHRRRLRVEKEGERIES